MEQPAAADLARSELETIRVPADLGDVQAKHQVAAIVRHDPAHFAIWLHIMAIRMESSDVSCWDWQVIAL